MLSEHKFAVQGRISLFAILVRHGHLCERISQVNSLRARYDAPYLTLLGGDRPVSPGLIALAWLWVALPFTYAVWQLFAKITQLFSA